MAYSINPNLVKARKTALLLILEDKLPVLVVARKCGVHRATIWRWVKKWRELNKYVSQSHPNRPNRKASFVPCYYHWTVVTESSKPNHSPAQLSAEIIKRVIELRNKLKRCAEVVYHYLGLEGVKISLSSVRRIFQRHHILDRKRHERRPYKRNIKRPVASKPGSLVETDTVHLIDPMTGKRKYVYTVIDLCTRMAYAKHTMDVVLKSPKGRVLKLADFVDNAAGNHATIGDKQRKLDEKYIEQYRIHMMGLFLPDSLIIGEERQKALRLLSKGHARALGRLAMTL